MRTLRFIVSNNTIKPDPNCDFGGLFPGTEQYVKAEFLFSPEWKSGVKVVGFWSPLGNEYPPQHLEDGKSCMIPTEALKRASFKMRVFGKCNGKRLSTNKLTVLQTGGKR